MTTPHVHAANMLLYAQDAAETDRPRTRWEVLIHGVTAEYVPLDCNPMWAWNIQYRRIRKMIKIGNRELVAPETYAPRDGTKAYVPGVDPSYWRGTASQLEYLSDGSTFLTKEDAEAMHQAQTQQRLGLA